jgi:hypothetical protein
MQCACGATCTTRRKCVPILSRQASGACPAEPSVGAQRRLRVWREMSALAPRWQRISAWLLRCVLPNGLDVDDCSATTAVVTGVNVLLRSRLSLQPVPVFVGQPASDVRTEPQRKRVRAARTATAPAARPPQAAPGGSAGQPGAPSSASGVSSIDDDDAWDVTHFVLRQWAMQVEVSLNEVGPEAAGLLPSARRQPCGLYHVRALTVQTPADRHCYLWRLRCWLQRRRPLGGVEGAAQSRWPCVWWDPSTAGSAQRPL